jgi:sulfide:quinone oxidoreductase
MPSGAQRPRIIIAGSGVAALEACLALRAFLAEDDLAIDLLCPTDRFEYRPLAVLEPFEAGAAWGMDLARFAADQAAGLVRDALASVDPQAHIAVTASGRRLGYDQLLVAAGAEPVRAIPGAVTFRGARDAEAVRAAIDSVDTEPVAFAVPEGTFWTLPIYELAMLAAARLAARDTGAQVAVVTSESGPVEAFGPRASAAVAELLDARDIRFAGQASPVAADAGDLELAGGTRLAADAVISLPRLLGRHIGDLARDAAGFVLVDEHGRVAGCDGVFAAGDITDFPLKQGGLAAQQADAAAETMLAELGLQIVPRPFAPVLQGRALHRSRARLPAGAERRAHDGAARLLAMVAPEQDRRALPVALPDDPRRSAQGAGGASRRRHRPRERRRRRGRSGRARRGRRRPRAAGLIAGLGREDQDRARGVPGDALRDTAEDGRGTREAARTEHDGCRVFLLGAAHDRVCHGAALEGEVCGQRHALARHVARHLGADLVDFVVQTR